jgi:hypothetical protein
LENVPTVEIDAKHTEKSNTYINFIVNGKNIPFTQENIQKLSCINAKKLFDDIDYETVESTSYEIINP